MMKAGTLLATLAGTAVLSSAAAATLTVRNFDEDLATVYVNGVAATNGATFAVGGTATLELKDIRSDYYFAYAPDTQADRTLALDFWEGLPAGAASNENPVAFAVSGDLTVTPNVDCKGHVWTANGTTSMADQTWTMAMAGPSAANRSVGAGMFQAYSSGERVMDFAKRVRFGGANYTVTSLATRSMFSFSDVAEIRVPKRLSSLAFALTDYASGGSFHLTNIVGLADSALTTVPSYAFHYNSAALVGPMADSIPRGVRVIGNCAYSGKQLLTGRLPLPAIVEIGGSAFASCSGVDELHSESPALATIGQNAFRYCSGLGKITLASPALSHVDPTAFATAAVFTNLTYLSAPPASRDPIDNLLVRIPDVDGDHALQMHLPVATPGWWDWIEEPTAAEVAAGLPARCVGVYTTGAGERKAWVIAGDDADSCLVETDMSHFGNCGYEIHGGLATGATLTLSRAGCTSCDLQHLNPATGAWETFATMTGPSFSYTHDGRLTRAMWRVPGVALNLFATRYGGSFTVTGATPILGGNVYASNAVLTVVAIGAAAHPTSHFTVWEEGVAGDAVSNAAVVVTMDGDKILRAAFDPDEWLYNSAAKTISDGEWVSSAAVTLDAGRKTVRAPGFSGGRNYRLWLDLALPVCVEDDPGAPYAIASLGVSQNTTLRKIRFGPRFEAFTQANTFRGSQVLERLDGLGGSRVANIPWCFLHDVAGPIGHQTYEANDFLPPALVSVSDYFYSGGPTLVGTLCLPNFKTFTAQNGGFVTRTTGVTNLLLTCAEMTGIPFGMFSGMQLQEATIGSTNFTASMAGPFSGSAETLERLVFLAHAPARAALDNVLASFPGRTTASAEPLEIHCPKYAPGWRALAAPLDRFSDEWKNRPAGTWGIYQTTSGKRFYLLKRPSPFDADPTTILCVR